MTCRADMTKIEKYKTLFEQIKAVVDDTDKEWLERIVSLL